MTVLTFFLIGIWCATLEVPRVKASGSIYIRANGSIDPPTVPISSTDNVTYTFTGDINDSIVVERSNIIIDGNEYTVQGSGSGDGFNLQGISNVTIKNINIEGFLYGIHFYSSTSNIVSGNNITANNSHGIFLHLYSDRNTINGNNVIANNDDGISLFYSSLNTISGNNITANNGYGIKLLQSSTNVLKNNSMSCNRYNFGIYGAFSSDIVNEVDISNTVDNKLVYYWIDKQNLTVPLDAGYVALIECENITVQNLNLTKNGQGIFLSCTTNTTITKNNIVNNHYGIWFFASCSYNSVVGNNIANNGDGVQVWAQSNCNSIVGNNITDNSSGIRFYWSSSNIIHHNNFVNNRDQVFIEKSTNIWDDGAEGNYWSDYLERYPNATEIDDSGVWNTPYVISDVYPDQDNYPIIPEFPSALVLLIFMITTLLATVPQKKITCR